MVSFTGVSANETIATSTVSATVTSDVAGGRPSDLVDSLNGTGGPGADRIHGGPADDLIRLNTAANDLAGGQRTETFCGGRGADCFACSPFSGMDPVGTSANGVDKMKLSGASTATDPCLVIPIA
ncbi:hypothetical protein SAMN07250955_1153 [Arboricoccus pini]|uniref:Hemolysin-type calcium-binding repeat-containing protein n=2 Tax=Arboricoccus pini TaxID=1963835 RepID=A0A212RUL5_9PROT|nr:hypothetical protein SAMN07250955_1153 [Arboricoccus pini]